jgi:hypothetical protein
MLRRIKQPRPKNKKDIGLRKKYITTTSRHPPLTYTLQR